MRKELEPWLIAALLVLLLSITGCSQQTPTFFNTYRTTTIPPDTRPMSDWDVLAWSDAIKNKWGTRSLNSEAFATGGEIAVAALATGTVVASGSGVSNGWVRGLAGAMAFLAQVLGIIKPAERDNAFSEGSGLILDAEGEYVIALTSRKVYRVPTDRMTKEGAQLLAKINAAVRITNSLMVGLLPRDRDIETTRTAIKPE